VLEPAAAYEWSTYDLATGLVTRSGRSGTIESLSIKAKAGEGLYLGAVLREGIDSVINDQPVIGEEMIVVTVADVKRWAGKLLSYTDWMITRAADPGDGTPVPAEVLERRATIRARSAVIEAMSPIPADYRDKKYWT
jgi:hypothetical protein